MFHFHIFSRQDWETLDEEIERGRKALLQLSDKFVLILRDKAMQARIRAHYAKINRSVSLPTSLPICLPLSLPPKALQATFMLIIPKSTSPCSFSFSV